MVSDTHFRQIADEIVKDTKLQHVIYDIESGWPAGSYKLFYHIRIELNLVGLLKHNRIVVPQSLSQDMLHKTHEDHPGVKKCKRRTRDTGI